MGAAVRGLDVPAVRHIVMFDMCDDVTTFIHSVGRTARRGEEGTVDCLVRSGTTIGRYRHLHELQHAAPLDFAAE